MERKPMALYDYNVCIVKKMGDRYKLSLLSACARGGIEQSGYNEYFDNSIVGQIEYIKKYAVHRSSGGDDYQRLDNNISRARAKIQEYVLCNDWQYFVTLTLDKNKYDRHDLDTFKKDLGMFINNSNKLRGSKLSYLLIPEQHEDGAWHMHGLINGLMDSELHELDRNYFDKHTHGKIPKYIMDKWKRGGKVYAWTKYADKFGYITLDVVRDSKRIASYIKKYITKDMAHNMQDCNKRLYLASRGLKTAEKLSKGHLHDVDDLKADLDADTSYCIDGQYCKTIWLDDTPENQLLIGTYFEPVRYNDMTKVSKRDEISNLEKSRVWKHEETLEEIEKIFDHDSHDICGYRNPYYKDGE